MGTIPRNLAPSTGSHIALMHASNVRSRIATDPGNAVLSLGQQDRYVEEDRSLLGENGVGQRIAIGYNAI